MFHIGVVSDTHNYLDPRVLDLFQGVDHILHGGDIGLPWVILELQGIAPVTAVMGNTDEAAFHYRETEVVELVARKFLLHHIVNPRSLEEIVASRIRRERPDVVVFGHTHKPFNEVIAGTHYFNPGYAGKSRFGMERSVAILHCDEKEIQPEFFTLSGP
jgi:putative phosphoesterase